MKTGITRRTFMGTSARGILIPSLIGVGINNLACGPGPEDGTVADYMKHFGVDEKIINDVISTALSRGGDYCDVFFQHTISNNIGLEDNIVNRASSNIDFGVGIRVLKGDQTGYSFSEEVTAEAMKMAADTAANIANTGNVIQPVELKYQKTPEYYSMEQAWEDTAINLKTPILQQINEKTFNLDKRIIKTSVRFGNETSYVMLATSEGRITCDTQPMVYLSASCTAEQNGKRESGRKGFSARQGFESITPELADRLAGSAVADAILKFEAVKPEGGEMPVVLGSGSSGILLHEAIGHGMEADFNRKEISIFSDKIGKKVAEDFVTIIDDGTIPQLRGSINVDDEGNDSQKTVLVENGIMTSYIHDRISARHYGLAPTGNGRRQSFRFEPVPRMRTTYMLNGPHTEEEIIASVKKGIYAQEFTNGQVMIGAGDFTFYVSSGYMIEDGKLTSPIKDINIIGNGPEVLSRITMVADNFKLDDGTWTCGKAGQGVPVSMGLPSAKVSSITVGGVS